MSACLACIIMVYEFPCKIYGWYHNIMGRILISFNNNCPQQKQVSLTVLLLLIIEDSLCKI